jgi:L-ribulokinase
MSTSVIPEGEIVEDRHPIAIGVDYGTQSGRVLVLDLVDGRELAQVVIAYRHGVIERQLPGSGEGLPADWALQHPQDYLDVLDQGIPAALHQAEVRPAQVIGLGIDFTSCTVLPVDADGRALALSPAWANHPHA